MAVIPGATVTFTDYSAPGTPRILNVPDAAGDVTVQDIWDTLSDIAARLENLPYKRLLNRPLGGGKSTLSLTKTSGITAVGNNVQLKFEDLAGPSYTIKRVTDGNWIAIDHLGVSMEEMANSTFVNWKNEADVSAGLVLVNTGDLAADTVTALKAALFDGLSFENSMKYLLSMSSGRFVKVDADTVDFYARDNTTVLFRLQLNLAETERSRPIG